MLDRMSGGAGTDMSHGYTGLEQSLFSIMFSLGTTTLCQTNFP